jgi:indole-3-glycerol phosphate synthase
MNILETIVAHKKIEVDGRKAVSPIAALEQVPAYSRNIFSLKAGLHLPNASGIIAEFKRKSPSKGLINGTADPVSVTAGYAAAGASAVSILTDNHFFGGQDEDILNCRPNLSIPVLRKEFIVDPYQIHESKALGADLILLIAACLSKNEVAALASLAHSLGMEVLLELHDVEELDHVCDDIDFVGINNRSLKTFDVNIKRSLLMAAQLPADKIKIAESGIDDPALLSLFQENGYSGFLIGECFMKHANPVSALQDFMAKIQN